MKTNPADSARPASHTWVIAVGEHAGHLERPGALSNTLRVLESGPDAGRIEIDIGEMLDRRVTLTWEAATALAHLIGRFQGDDALRFAHALLDAVHLAKRALGLPSELLTHGDLERTLREHFEARTQ